MAVSLADARVIVKARLGRDLRPDEEIDLKTVLDAGITEEQLQSIDINASDPAGSLFPTFVVSGEQFESGQQAKVVALAAPEQAAAVAGGFVPGQAFDPFAGGAATAPNQGYDPFSFGLEAESSFILGERRRKVGSGQVRPITPDGMQLQTGSIVSTVQVPVETTVRQFITQVVKWSPERVKNLQKSLQQAGLLTEGSYVEGFADTSTLNALGIGIGQAQQRDISLPDLLSLRARGVEEQAGGGGAAEPSAREIAKSQYKQGLIGIYMNNWGEPPPPGYIEKIMASGMNTYEFNSHERAKPAFRNSPKYQMERLSVEAQIASTLGSLG
jgi:hypothetical protein